MPITNSFTVSTFTAEAFSIDQGVIVASDPSQLELTPGLLTDFLLTQPDRGDVTIYTGQVQQVYSLTVQL